MSVRRLAEASVQPASFAFNKAFTAQAKTWIKKYPKGREQSAVIPLLMLAQEQDGWVTKAAIEHVADMLAMPYIRALEVATFYTQFQLKPVGTRAHIQVCGTTPCMLRGSEELIDVCRSKIHHDQFHTNEAGTLSWEEVECLGACVNAPMVMIFKDTYEDLTPERLAEIIDQFDAGKGDKVKTGPQTGRVFAAPLTGFTSLKEEKGVLKTTRDKEAKAATKAAKAAAVETAVPPSNAAKPKTDAIETSPAVKSPSKVKAAPAAEKAASVAAPKAAVAAKPSLEDKNRPAGIAKPAAVDDLKLISGVGPKIEGTLHELGIFTFGQVASWKKAEREWVDGYLNFKGRIERDDWVKQAKALAKGGVAEYVRVFGKKPV
ncbi:NADH dehydrogenase subunit E [Aminobacter aminovorans]|uniref:NADH-quinone oxidoreductase chain 2 n=1 Tax=Aminobacter aminovorans TaxID=83263 RepID=A0A380WK00_AMIAI|nr:NADH-quinone oxidoreductase subunit E [Aminobacter aminovorans]TCS24153.1 NADH dehydrogenase subunit E [Aminobacter aminovorans]SUU89339.1 NADH-quinone oxidoreductase chain 2 [Aminobacter aminovorans]